MISKTLGALCKLLGHNWRYKDYSNWMIANGEEYHFKASRNCLRCNQNEYLYKAWELEATRSVHDIKSDAFSSKQLPY